MADWKKHEIPDWVVDDYNSRVSKEDRLPLNGMKKHNDRSNRATSKTAAYIKRYNDIQYRRTVTDIISDWIDDNHSMTVLLIIIFSAAFAVFLVK